MTGISSTLDVWLIGLLILFVALAAITLLTREQTD